MKILVLGAGGYVGIPLVEELARRGHEVMALDRWFFGKQPNTASTNEGGTFRGDIRTVREEGFEGVEAVIDLAGLSNDASADIDLRLTQEINVEGAERCMRLAKRAGVRRYIYSSSASVYGHGDEPNLTETSLVHPLTAYAQSKVVTEGKLRSGQGPDEFVILRNATVFGIAPRMRFDLAVNIMVLRAWRDRLIYVMGGGQQWRPFVHVDDVVRVFCWMVEAPAEKVRGEIFNVGSDALNLTIEQLAQKVRQAFHDAEVHQIPDDVDRRSYHVSFVKLHDVLQRDGESKFRTVEAGISEIASALRRGTMVDDPTCHTVAWYKNLLDWDRRLNDLRLDGRIL